MVKSVCSAVLCAAILLAAGCRNPSASGSAQPGPPAKVQNGGQKESDLAQVVLTPEAGKRLGIALGTVTEGVLPQTRTYAGEVIVPPGAAATVTAPVAGMLSAAETPPPSGGSRVAAGQPLMVLRPVAPLPRDLRVNVETEIAAARARSDASRARAARAERLLLDQVGSVRAVETAREELLVAETALAAAQARLQQLDRAPLEAGVSWTVAAPHAGVVRQIFAVPGQAVAAGAALLEIVRLDTLWIRVPIYSGQTRQLRQGAGAEVRALDGSIISRAARAVLGPPSANPLASTSDLYFELPGTDGRLRPGERVSVILEIQGENAARGLQAPWAAVVFDAHGGAWVYQSLGNGGYRRRRVEVGAVRNGVAGLVRGPEAGTRVVIAGAAELFATEFGPGK